MASSTGTATDFQDFYDDLITFLTTDSALVAASQEWDTKRERKHNLASITTNGTPTAASWGSYLSLTEVCRYDHRSSNVQDEDRNLYFSSYTDGVTRIDMELVTAKTADYIRLQAGTATWMVKDFKVQYSSDDISYTTAATITGQTGWGAGEVRSFALSVTGSHQYWRIIVDDGNHASILALKSIVILNGTEVINQFGNEIILEGPGLAGTDSIFVGIRTEHNASDGWYNVSLNGFSGYDSGEDSWFKQPGAIPTAHAVPMVPLEDDSMSYWFNADGRAFQFVAKVSTQYESGYAGFIDPYSTPGQFPYPLVVAGSLSPSSNRGTDWQPSFNASERGSIAAPGGTHDQSTPNTEQSTMYMRHLDGNWRGYSNRTGADVMVDDRDAYRCVWPHSAQDGNNGRLPYRDCIGGGYMAFPCVMYENYPNPQVMGVLRGIKWVSGFSMSAEDTTTIDGDSYVIFQNGYRSGVPEYFALELS